MNNKENKHNNSVSILIVVISLVFILSLNGLLLQMALDGRKQRRNIEDGVKRIVCVLLIEPEDRTPQNAEECEHEL